MKILSTRKCAWTVRPTLFGALTLAIAVSGVLAVKSSPASETDFGQGQPEDFSGGLEPISGRENEAYSTDHKGLQASEKARLAQDCPEPHRHGFFAKFIPILTKGAVERLIEDEIRYYRSEQGRVDWDCLIQHFLSLGENYSVLVFHNAGIDNSDVFRFTVENKNIITFLMSAPGASNGVFTAIVNQTVDGRIAIIERGGDPRWLKFE